MVLRIWSRLVYNEESMLASHVEQAFGLPCYFFIILLG
jgi:hypothetical protein